MSSIVSVKTRLGGNLPKPLPIPGGALSKKRLDSFSVSLMLIIGVFSPRVGKYSVFWTAKEHENLSGRQLWFIMLL